MRVLPLLVFPIFFAVAVWLLQTGHPHEDAYILMIYARNLAEGLGIVYFPGGAPAEGATDFLWMLLLALAEYLGSDAALVAAILNGLGLSLIAMFAIKLAITDAPLWRSWLTALTLVFLILCSQISQASLAGFSTGLYCAGVAGLFYLLYYREPRCLAWIPVISIVLGLLRPDGVIIGVTASVIGLYFAYQAKLLRPYLRISAVCVAIGLTYFVWRLHYFGHWLPLPLMVKSVNPETLPGLSRHIGWASRNFYLGIIALASFTVLQERWRIILASIPTGVLLIALLFATQHQNIVDRFQAPATTVLILWCALLLRALTYKGFQKQLAWGGPVYTAGIIVLFLACADNFRATLGLIAYSRSEEYVNTLPYLLLPHVNHETTFALTEAGAFAYWLPGRKVDLVGLNTPATALRPVSPSDIEGIDPDLIFIHLSGTANFHDICAQNYCELSPKQVQEGIRVDYDWSQTGDGVYRAPLAVMAHLQASTAKYRVYTVLFNGDYNHLYLVKTSGRLHPEDFEQALQQSFEPGSSLSYWQLRGKIGAH